MKLNIELPKRPPLGLMPKNLHDVKRALDILDAMERYASVQKPIPLEWVQELKMLYPYERT